MTISQQHFVVKRCCKSSLHSDNIKLLVNVIFRCQPSRSYSGIKQIERTHNVCPAYDGASLTWKEPPPSQVVQEAKDPVEHFSSRQLFEGTINATLRWRFTLTGLHFQSCAILFGGNTVALISSSVIGTPPSYAKRFGFDWIPNQHLMKLFIFNVSMKDNGTFSCQVTADTLDRFSEFHFKSHVLVDVVDVDECKNNICDANTVCNNTEGSYVCRCNEGYTGNGRICTDLNECESPETNQCDPNAECDNTEGSYTCNCSVGYTGDGKNCTAETCPIPMDTTFIIDASVCDKSENWNRVLNFVQTLVTYFDVSKPVGRIALIPFSTDAKVVLKLNSLSGELLNGKEVNKRVSALQCQGGSRRIDKALELAAKEVVTTENGLRAGVSRPVFVIVTGKQTTNQGASTSLAEASRRLQIQGSAVFVLGIGKDVDPRELSEIASGQKNVFTVNSFKDLEKKVHELKRGICVLDIDECASPETNDCDPNAECSNTKGSYTCSCNKGYTGDGRTCTAFITKPSSPSYAVEGQNLTLVWTYTLDGTVGLSQFAIVSGGSELLIGRRFGPGVITIEPGYQARFRARATKTRAELSILAVQRSDERTYRVNVVPTGAGSLVQSVDVIVNFPPTITEISGSQTVTEGSNVTLKCLADGKPMPNITWSRLFDNRVVSMTLTDIRRQDAGRYRCIVDNGIGSPAATDVLIVVQYPVEATSFGENATVSEGGNKTFSCPVDGNPQPNITWYRSSEDSGKPICYEKELEARESGCYTCVASNSLGQSISITQCLEMNNLPQH